MNKVIAMFRPGPIYVLLKFLQQIDNFRVSKFGGMHSAFLNHFRFVFFMKWLLNQFHDKIEYWNCQPEQAIPFTNLNKAPIWFCWLQGEAQMPQMIRSLYSNLLKKANGHPVILVTENNINRFVHIDEEVLLMYKNGSISAAFFTDVLRFALLKEHGGVWVDATILIANKLDDCIFSYPFWNVKGLHEDFPFSSAIVDAKEWQSYFLATQPNALFAIIMYDLLVEYIKKYQSVCEYFLVFYFAKIVRDKIDIIHQEYDSIPDNNTRCECLHSFLIKWGNANIACIKHNDTWVYKLSRHDWDNSFSSTIKSLFDINIS